MPDVVPQDIHVHVHLGEEDPQILKRLTSMESLMSDMSGAMNNLSTAINDVSQRIDEDVAHLQDLLNQAMATDAADQATIAQLQADAAQTIQRLNASTDQLQAIDPIKDFPAQVPPASAETNVTPANAADPNKVK